MNAEAFPGGPLSAIFAKRTFIDLNRATIERFNRALKESIDYMMADTPRGKKMVVEFTGLDSAIVEKMVYSRYNYDVVPEKWQLAVDWYGASARTLAF
jgi:ABC-type nitrate/sulfonate/bicarbonate transport system substrate-binding protein